MPVIHLLDSIRPDFIDHDVIVYDHDGKGLTDEVKNKKWIVLFGGRGIRYNIIFSPLDQESHLQITILVVK